MANLARAHTSSLLRPLLQYWTVEGKPLLFYTLRTLEAIDWLQQVVVPVAADMLDTVQCWLTDWQLQRPRLVLAGSTRHRFGCCLFSLSMCALQFCVLAQLFCHNPTHAFFVFLLLNFKQIHRGRCGSIAG